MPVRSSSSHVLSWPDRDTVAAAARAWGARVAAADPNVLKIGYFGSCARGDWGVGSDLDIVIVVARSSEPPMRRGLAFDTLTGLPVPVDLLVYTAEEWQRLQDDTSTFTHRLRDEVVWIV